jgi:hypothetical protein
VGEVLADGIVLDDAVDGAVEGGDTGGVEMCMGRNNAMAASAARLCRSAPCSEAACCRAVEADDEFRLRFAPANEERGGREDEEEEAEERGEDETEERAREKSSSIRSTKRASSSTATTTFHPRNAKSSRSIWLTSLRGKKFPPTIVHDLFEYVSSIEILDESISEERKSRWGDDEVPRAEGYRALRRERRRSD